MRDPFVILGWQYNLELFEYSDMYRKTRMVCVMCVNGCMFDVNVVYGWCVLEYVMTTGMFMQVLVFV